MAALHRPVVYYRFDPERFYGGDHHCRDGYFRDETDGFGRGVFDRDGASNLPICPACSRHCRGWTGRRVGVRS